MYNKVDVCVAARGKYSLMKHKKTKIMMPHLLSSTTQDFPGHRIYFMMQNNTESGNITLGAGVCGDAFVQILPVLSVPSSPFQGSNKQN